jgi:hypothetical protein
MAHPDQVLSPVGAPRQDFVVRAADEVIGRGWKVRPEHPRGDGILLLHGRSHSRSERVRLREFILAAGYGVVMREARAHDEGGGSNFGNASSLSSPLLGLRIDRPAIVICKTRFLEYSILFGGTKSGWQIPLL